MASHELAAQHQLPIRRVEVILTGLRQAGLIRSPGGRRGGYVLTDGASLRPVLDFVRATALMVDSNQPQQAPQVAALVVQLTRSVNAQLQELSLAQLATFSS